MSLPIWAYWEGPQPAWIGLCLETLRRHNPTISILGPAEWEELWTSRGPEESAVRSMHPVPRSDYIRAYLLHHHGGLWVDADCIALGPFGFVEGLLELAQMVTYYAREQKEIRPQEPHANAFLGLRKGCSLSEGMLSMVRKRAGMLECRNRTSVLGASLVSGLMRAKRPHESVIHLDHSLVHPLLTRHRGLFKAVRTDEQHARHVGRDAVCYMLTHQYIAHLQTLSRDAILADPSFGGYLFRRALGLSA